MLYVGVSDSQKKVPPLPPSVASRSDSGSGRAFDDGATFLTFNPSTFDGKLPIIDYVVVATPETGNAVTLTVANLAPFVFTGLRSGIRYTYSIRARNEVFESANSTGAGPDTVTTVPGRPTSLTAINLANGGGISLSWTAPSNAGKAITSYTITPSVGSPIVTNSAATTYSFSGVVGTTYNFTIAATNQNGTGLDSTASGTVTPTPAPTPVPTPPPTVIQGPTTGINSFTAGSTVNGSGQLVVNGSWSAFGYQSWSLSGIGTSTGVVNGTASSGVASTGPVPSQFCGQTATATLTVYSGTNGTGTSASSTANFTVQASGTGCPTGGGTVTTSTYWYTVCCKTGNNYATISRESPQSASYAAYFAEQACTSGGGTVQGGQSAYGTSAPTISCSAPVTLSCSKANGNCGTAACQTCDPSLSSTRTDTVPTSTCPSGQQIVETCWTPGDCDNIITRTCVPGGTPYVPPSSSAIIVPTTSTPGVTAACAGPCNGTWSVVNGVCRCTSTATPTPAPTVCVPTSQISVGNCTIYFDSCGNANTVCPSTAPATPTPAPATPTPTADTSGCTTCRDARGRCLSASRCFSEI